MKKNEILKPIKFELKSRLDVLNTNDISREKVFWKRAIKGYEDSLNNAYEFLNSISIDHDGLTREQYLAHCIRVSALGFYLSKISPEKVGIIGLIHNIMEISDVNHEDIIDHFGMEVYEGLSALKVDRKLQTDPDYLRKYYHNIANINSYLMNVKVVDKLDNLYLLGLNPNDKVRTRYLEEIKEYIVPLSRNMDGNLAVYIEKLIDYNQNVGHFTKKIKL